MSELFSVVVLTGGPPRSQLSAKCIDSINSQSYQNIQKILVNNGRPSTEMTQIIEFKSIDVVNEAENRLQNWEVLSLKDSAFDPLDYTSIWKIPGITALNKVKGKYLFCINDDDYLDKDFFLNMSNLFLKYPDAITAFGFPLTYEVKSGKVSAPKFGSWVNRPEYEDGINVSLNWLKFDRSYHPNPGFSFVVQTKYVRPIQEMFFSGGFPDITALIQIVPFGKTIFNKNALMYLGRHERQQRNDWDEENRQLFTYQKAFTDMLAINLKALHKVRNTNIKLERLVKYYFIYSTVEAAFYAIYPKPYIFFLSRNLLSKLKIFNYHLFTLLKHPLMFGKVLSKELRNIRFIKKYLSK
jgi:hypothetical protein